MKLSKVKNKQKRSLTPLEQRQLILIRHESKPYWVCNNLNDSNNLDQMSNRLYNLGLFCLKDTSSILKDILVNIKVINKGHIDSWDYERMYNFLNTKTYKNLLDRIKINY